MLSGVSEEAIAVLEEELVLNTVVFSCLREEHFEKLLPKLKVGDHAALLKVWDNSSMQEAEVHIKLLVRMGPYIKYYYASN